MTKKTKTIIRFLLLAGTIISLFFVPWILVKAWILPLPNTIEQQLKQATELGFTGIILYTDKAGKTPSFYADGLDNRESKTKANPHSLFKIGSISKLYTAVTITKLAHSKQLFLNKSITYYLPQLKGKIENADKITLRMLVQHRSGIPNFTDTPDYWATPLENNKEKLELIYDLPANFAPGESYEYCNTNYILLAEIMNKVLSYPYFQFIKKEILDKHQLKHTFQSVKNVDIDQVMSGYHVGHPYDLKADNQGMVATAEDVGIFVRKLNNGTLLNKEEQKIYASLYEFEHKGWVPGYQSIAKYHAGIDAVVVQFTNTTDPKLYYWNLADIEYNRIIKIIKQTN